MIKKHLAFILTHNVCFVQKSHLLNRMSTPSLDMSISVGCLMTKTPQFLS